VQELDGKLAYLLSHYNYIHVYYALRLFTNPKEDIFHHFSA